VAAAVLCSSWQARADEPVRLRFKMEPNHSQIYQSTTEVNQTQNLAGMEFKNVVESSDVTVYTLQEVSGDGNLHLQAENRQMKTRMDLGQVGEYIYDSKSSDRDRSSLMGAALTPIYDALNGAVIQVTVTPRGEVTEVKGLKELIGEDLLKDNPFAAQAATVATDEGAKISYSDRFIELPEEPVEPGDTWEQPYEIKMPGLGIAKGKTVYKFDGRDKVGDRETVRIVLRDEMSLNLDLDQMGAKVTGQLSVTSSSGTAQFDPAAGVLVSKTTTQTFSGNLNVAAGGQNIPVQQEQKHTTKIELLDKAPE
jgi:hypothetical protein